MHLAWCRRLMCYFHRLNRLLCHQSSRRGCNPVRCTQSRLLFRLGCRSCGQNIRRVISRSTGQTISSDALSLAETVLLSSTVCIRVPTNQMKRQGAAVVLPSSLKNRVASTPQSCGRAMDDSSCNDRVKRALAGFCLLRCRFRCAKHPASMFRCRARMKNLGVTAQSKSALNIAESIGAEARCVQYIARRTPWPLVVGGSWPVHPLWFHPATIAINVGGKLPFGAEVAFDIG